MADYELKRIFSRNLTNLLRRRGKTQQEFAKMMEVSTAAVSGWCTGAKIPRMDRIDQIAAYLNVSRGELLNDTPIPPGFEPLPQTDHLPRVGRIACGQPITAEENLEGYDDVPSEWRADFTLRCRGDSMLPSIQDGDIVAIRKQPMVENGEVAAVRIGDEATLKHVYLYPTYIELRPENPAYESTIKMGEEMNTVTIEGKAVGLCRGL